MHYSGKSHTICLYRGLQWETGPYAQRWMISKILFRMAVRIHYKKTTFWFAPDKFMQYPTIPFMENITINLWSPQWNAHTIGTECACDLQKTESAVEAYPLQKRLQECAGLVTLLRFMPPHCKRTGDHNTQLKWICLSKADLSDLQRWRGVCDCCVFSKKSNKCSLPLSV